jgi:hypothetical protein
VSPPADPDPAPITSSGVDLRRRVPSRRGSTEWLR